MKRATCLMGLGTLLAAGTQRVRAADLPSIRVLYEPIDTATAVFCARDMGFFSRAGVSVDLQPMSTGSAMLAAATSGSVDVVLPNVLSLAEAVEGGLAMQVISANVVYTAKNPSTLLLVENASPIAGARDFSGKTIAVNVLNGLAWVAARAWIDRNGGDSKAVRFVEMPFSTMPDALTAGRVEGAVVAEPALSIARRDARVLAPVYSAIAPTFPIDAWVAPSSWIAANRDAARRFARAMHDACVWANANHDGSAEIAAGFTKLDAAVIRGRTRATFAEAGGFAAAQPLLDAGVAYGVLKKPLRATDLVAPGMSL
jgi:NitT/TauT family transport system substrate-binding protein